MFAVNVYMSKWPLRINSLVPVMMMLLADVVVMVAVLMVADGCQDGGVG